jgi:hypothetical protein
MTIAGARLCVLRARFFRFEVRRFGTAIEYSSGLPGVAADALVQIEATRRTKSLAVGTAEHERGDFEEPLFTKSGPQIDFDPAATVAQRKDVGVIIALNSSFGVGEQEMRFRADLGLHLYQTAATLPQRETGKASAEVVPTRSSHREPSGHLEGTRGPLIAFQPDLVVGVEVTINRYRTDCQRPCWKRQHSDAIYPSVRQGATLRPTASYAWRISSVSAKKNRASRAAFSSESEAWIAFRPFDSA